MNRELHRLDADVPDPVESRRAGAGRVVRIIYATLVTAIVGFFIVRFGAPLVLLNGPGVVSAQRSSVSKPYLVQIRQMEVTPGSTVQSGAPIASVRSPQHDEIVANLMRGLADVTGREADLRVKSRVARDSLEAARSRVQMADETLHRLEESLAHGTASLIYRSDVFRERAQAVQNLAALEAEADEASNQLTRLGTVQTEIRSQLDQVKQEFDDGRVLSPATGIIAPQTRRVGETVVAGSAIAEVLVAGDTFVDWYIPDFRLTDPRVGQKVLVVLGRARLPGTVSEILPIEGRLEAQRSSILREPTVGQIGRIRFDPGVEPPTLNSTVHVHMYYTEFGDRIARAVVRLFNLN